LAGSLAVNRIECATHKGAYCTAGQAKGHSHKLHTSWISP